MKLSPNTRYAIRMLFELARTSEPLPSALLAERAGLSMRVVENIQHILKQNEITSGTVGARGGIRIIKPLSEISLGDMIVLFDNGIEMSVCSGEKSNDCPNQEFCETRTAWSSVAELIQTQLNTVSLETVLHKLPKTGILECLG